MLPGIFPLLDFTSFIYEMYKNILQTFEAMYSFKCYVSMISKECAEMNDL